jgi:hypothetical protein
MRTVQELMGHKSIVTTMRYAHLAPGHEAEAVERLVSSTSTPTSTRDFKPLVNEMADWRNSFGPLQDAGAGGGNRTHDLGIMRPSLYH